MSYSDEKCSQHRLYCRGVRRDCQLLRITYNGDVRSMAHRAVSQRSVDRAVASIPALARRRVHPCCISMRVHSCMNGVWDRASGEHVRVNQLVHAQGL